MNDLVKKTKNDLSEILDRKQEEGMNSFRNFMNRSGNAGSLLLIGVLLLVCVITFVLLHNLLVSGVSSMISSFGDAYQNRKNETYQKYHSYGFENGEEDYRNSITAEIKIGNLNEISHLEVFTVTESQCVTENDEELSKGIHRWIEGKGKGIYVIDLNGAEFILDAENRYVLARVPRPVLKDVEIRDSTVLLNEYDEKSFLFISLDKGTYYDGFNIINRQESALMTKLKTSISENQEYYHMAEKAGLEQIQRIIKMLNGNDENLVVEVEYID